MSTVSPHYRQYVACLQNCVQDKVTFGWEYTATEPLVFPIPPHLAEGIKPIMVPQGWLSIMPPARGSTGEPWWLMVAEKYSTDGCTGAPDFFRGWSLSRVLYEIQHANTPEALAHAAPFVAHWGHDAVYQFARPLAQLWGWRINEVLTWGDHLFGWTMQDCGGLTPDRQIYYRGVRTFGRPFNFITRQFR